jgi:hypothetical protein
MGGRACGFLVSDWYWQTLKESPSHFSWLESPQLIEPSPLRTTRTQEGMVREQSCSSSGKYVLQECHPVLVSSCWASHSYLATHTYTFQPLKIRKTPLKPKQFLKVGLISPVCISACESLLPYYYLFLGKVWLLQHPPPSHFTLSPKSIRCR